MEEAQKAFEEFLLWFIDVPEIPLTARRDFLKHLLEVGSLDETSAKFIEDTMQNLLQRAEGRAQELKERYESLKTEITRESDPQTSKKTTFIREVGEDMMKAVDDLEEKIRTTETESAQKAETAEKSEEEAEIERIKGGL